MIGLVIVSHSATLAEGVRELAEQVARGRVRIATAGGTGDPRNPLGTDAFRVLEAIESVYGEDGVLVTTDLGSALLSAETAVEMLDEAKRGRVRLGDGPLVEGTVAAASLAGTGASLEEVVAGAYTPVPASAGGKAGEAGEEVRVTLRNPLGLHLRPAAQLVRLAAQFEASVTVNGADATSLNGLLGLGARQGATLALRARGKDAEAALAALAGFIESGCGEAEKAAPAPVAAPAQPQPREEPGALSGIPASAGIAIGPLVNMQPAEAAPTQAGMPVPLEEARLNAALRAAGEETRRLCESSRQRAGEAEAGIFEAQLLFLKDPELRAAASANVRERHLSAEAAWQAALAGAAARLESLEDPYLRARAADLRDVAARVVRILTGKSGTVPRVTEPSILAAHDLTPSEVQQLDRNLIAGLCLAAGAAGAHSLILARAMGIPAVTGLGPAILNVPEGTPAALDGETGRVWIAPDAEQAGALRDRRRSWLEERRRADERRLKPGSTRDGHRVRLFANISGVSDAAAAVAAGAEGVGVLRTEFLFVGRKAPPGEDEQAAAYTAIAEALGGRPLVVRTLDIGGDKHVPYVDIGEESNPFLGWRGIRLTLGRRDLFDPQLRAILRAGFGRDVRILFPMISSLDELRRANRVVAEAAEALERAGIPHQASPKTGIMIEVPGAVAVAAELALETAFFSIGSNDLIQYVMVADRTNPRVASMADPFQPAVLRTIGQAIDAGHAAGIEVALCGELGADRVAAPLLIGLGLDELSVSAPFVPEVKQEVARWSLEEARRIAREALALDSGEAVRALLARARETAFL
jgi:multiphosphoryl transfer protein